MYGRPRFFEIQKLRCEILEGAQGLNGKRATKPWGFEANIRILGQSTLLTVTKNQL